MRFSLVSLLLFTIWIGAALGVWFRREAWVLERFEKHPVPLKPSWTINEDNLFPDGRRKLKPIFGESGNISLKTASYRFQLLIFDRVSGEVLYNFFDIESAYYVKIHSDDTLEVIGYMRLSERGQLFEYGVGNYRRRFPEWWWGHFYRPEVWAFTLTTIALLVRGVQALRRRRQARAV